VDLESWRVAPGTFLAAWPDLPDPNFTRAVLMICQHGARGAHGLVINRPTGLCVDQLLPDHKLLGALRTPVYLGGPVDHTRLQFLHCVPERIPGGLPISGDLHLGGSLEALAGYLTDLDLPRGQDPAQLRFFLGYSGWGESQLEQELMRSSWLPAALNLPLLFRAQGEDDWRRVIASIEGVSDALPATEDSAPN
jgi:putative transcriptional regulator